MGFFINDEEAETVSPQQPGRPPDSGMPPLLGLVVLFGPAGCGKTWVLQQLDARLGMPIHRLLEPAEPSTAGWPEAALHPTTQTDGEGRVRKLPPLDQPLDLEQLPPVSAMDSLRALLYNAPGSALKGGLSGGALLLLTHIHNQLVAAEKGLIATINPVYTAESGRDQYSTARELISGSVGGLVQPRTAQDVNAGSFWGSNPTQGNWEVYRDRYAQLGPWTQLFNSYSRS